MASPHARIRIHSYTNNVPHREARLDSTKWRGGTQPRACKIKGRVCSVSLPSMGWTHSDDTHSQSLKLRRSLSETRAEGLLAIGNRSVQDALDPDSSRFRLKKAHTIIANAQSKFGTALQFADVAFTGFREALDRGKDAHRCRNIESPDIGAGLIGPLDSLQTDSL